VVERKKTHSNINKTRRKIAPNIKLGKIQPLPVGPTKSVQI